MTPNGTSDFVLVAILLITPSDQEDPESPQAPRRPPSDLVTVLRRVFTEVLKRAGTGVWVIAPRCQCGLSDPSRAGSGLAHGTFGLSLTSGDPAHLTDFLLCVLKSWLEQTHLQ